MLTSYENNKPVAEADMIVSMQIAARKEARERALEDIRRVVISYNGHKEDFTIPELLERIDRLEEY